MVEFMDDTKSGIQDNLYEHLCGDGQNKFMQRLRYLLQNIFKQFREFERSQLANAGLFL
jgi:hypothetical protein